MIIECFSSMTRIVKFSLTLIIHAADYHHEVTFSLIRSLITSGEMYS